MQGANYSGVFSNFVPAPHQGFPSWTTYGESTVYELKILFAEMGVLDGLNGSR
jgi:hypothetical protein